MTVYPMGQVLRRIRKDRGLNYRKAADLAGIQIMETVAAAEQNFSTHFTVTKTILKLLRAYGCTIEIIVRDPAAGETYRIRTGEEEDNI